MYVCVYGCAFVHKADAVSVNNTYASHVDSLNRVPITNRPPSHPYPNATYIFIYYAQHIFVLVYLGIHLTCLCIQHEASGVGKLNEIRSSRDLLDAHTHTYMFDAARGVVWKDILCACTHITHTSHHRRHHDY